MNIQVCVNCQNKQHVNGTSNRLVTETCGHVKCMKCLLEETAGCLACQAETTKKDEQVLETEKNRTVEENETQQTDLEISGTEQNAEDSVSEETIQTEDVVVTKETIVVTKKGEPVEADDSVVAKEIVVTKEIVVVESKCSTVDVPMEMDKKEEQDWSTKEMFNPDLPHIRIDKDAAGATMYYCLKCKKKFRARSHCNYHYYCNGRKKPYSCAECSKGHEITKSKEEFATLTHYQYHMRTHGSERPFSCEVCAASFRHLSKLQRHKLLHSAEKPYPCGQCPRRFTSSTALRRHGLLHSGERPHQCPVCLRRFRDHSNCRKHVLRHGEERQCLCGTSGTGGTGDTADSGGGGGVSAGGRGRGGWRCPRCQLAFRFGKDMRRHLHVHQDSKPFRCRVCDHRFRRKDNLERHIRNKHPTHTAASAVDCDLDALRERNIVTIKQTETTKVAKEASDKTQLEKLNPLPPMPKDVIQSMCEQPKPTTDNTEAVIDKSYILEANNARQSVIVAKITAEADKQLRDSSPETAYVHKIKKSMAFNAKDSMLPPIDTNKLFEFYKEARKPEHLDIGAPLPENVHKLKTILMVDERRSQERSQDTAEQHKATMHWRRKMTLNINW